MGYSCAGKVDGHFDLVDDQFERLVGVACGVHAGRIIV